MKIIILSDTHSNVANLKKVLKWSLQEGIDLILHCGDIGSPESLKEALENFFISNSEHSQRGELKGVLGNVDKDFLLEDYNKIPGVEINSEILGLKIDNISIAITHFSSLAKKLAESQNYDFIFYGHTHKPWEEKIGNCKLVNPGELAGQFYKPTFAVLDTTTRSLELKILEKLTFENKENNC